MIKYYKRRLKDTKLIELTKFDTGCWINVIKPTKSELEFLTNNFKIDDEMLEDALDPNELPGIFFEDEGNFIYLKTVHKRKKMTTVLIVVASNFILTLSQEDVPLLKDIMQAKFGLITTQRQKSVIKILTLNNDYLEDLVMQVVKKVNTKKSGHKELNESDLGMLLESEEVLNNLSSTYTYTQRLYNKMFKKISFFNSDKDDLEDMITESEQSLNVCMSSLKTISNIRNYYSLQMSNKLNKTITILTIFTILISIFTALSGLYGMNVALPIQNNPYAFYYIIAISVLLMFIFVYYLRKKKILF